MNTEIINNQDNILSKEILGILFLYNQPINILKIKEFLDREVDNSLIIESLNNLEKEISNLGLAIVKYNRSNQEKNEYKLVLNSDFKEIAKRIRKEELDGPLTPAALQVLTICAYLGSATKNEISFIRGVQSTQSIRSLMVRGLLKKVGDKYVLSIDTLQNLGIKQIEDLPEYEKIKQDFKERLAEIITNDKEGNN